MKKCLAIILFAALCLSCLCMSTWAATDQEILSAELQGLFFQDSDFIYSDVAEDYEAWWWEDYVEETDSFPMAAYINMRGFSMSADGRYAYMGTLNGGSGVRGVVVLDTQKGRITDLYYTYNEINALEGSPFSYAKGIAADERGYVYVGFAYSSNYNYLSLGVAKQEENGELTEICQIPVYQNEYQPGDSIGTKIGVNGVEVAKVGDKYYCFVMSNYEHDVLYCYDVTDPANPVLNKDFGFEGMIDFADEDCPIELDGKKLDEGQYMAVDDNGTVWLCASLQGGGTGIIKIDPAGTTCQAYIEQSGAYSIAHEGNYLLVGLKDGSAIEVLDDSTYEKVGSIEVPDADRVTRIQLINDTLYVCGAGNDSMTYNYIYAAPLNADAKAAFDAQVAKLNAYQQSEDDGEETETETETDAEATTEAITDAETEATTQAQTNAPGTQAPQTDAPTETEAQQQGGCGSIIGSGALIAISVLGACLIVKKKKD
ncbi:MAG: SMP-30/gluconolactonase/LRE family protein [Ruminococcaceae bacterium]|nr:SMP-30/gluconolactonase/LRE family protein [Oscillospiraceae bacterium]